MAVVIRLQGLPIVAGTMDIRHFFSGLTIPDGGVHIVGGEHGEAFMVFATDEDARLGMMRTGGAIKGSKVSLLLSSKTEMHNMIELSRRRFETGSGETAAGNGSRPGGPPASTAGSGRGFSNTTTATTAPSGHDSGGNKNPSTYASSSASMPPSFSNNYSSPAITTLASHNSGPPPIPSLPPMPTIPPMPVPPPVSSLPPVPTVSPLTQGPPVPPMSHLAHMSAMPPFNPGVPPPGGMAQGLPLGTPNHMFLGHMNPLASLNLQAHMKAAVGGAAGLGGPPVGLGPDDLYAHLQGLPFTATEMDIRDMFQGLGLDSIRLLRDNMGRSSGRALVKFFSPQDTFEAVKRGGALMGQRFVEISPASERQWASVGGPAHSKPNNNNQQESQDQHRRGSMTSASPGGRGERGRSRSPQKPEFCVYLKGLPYEADKKQIFDFFKNLEMVEDSLYIAYGPTGRATGEGFVEFKNEMDYKAALGSHMQYMGSRFIQVHPISKKGMFEKIDSIRKRMQGSQGEQKNSSDPAKGARNCGHISNIPYNVSKKDVRLFLEGVGVFEDSLKVLVDGNGNGLGQAVVQFRSEDDAHNAERLHRQKLNGRDAFVHLVTFEQMKEIERNPPPQVKRGQGKVQGQGSSQVQVHAQAHAQAHVQAQANPFGMTGEEFNFLRNTVGNLNNGPFVGPFPGPGNGLAGPPPLPPLAAGLGDVGLGLPPPLVGHMPGPILEPPGFRPGNSSGPPGFGQPPFDNNSRKNGGQGRGGGSGGGGGGGQGRGGGGVPGADPLRGQGAAGPGNPRGGGPTIVKIQNMPFTVTVDEIMDFFYGYQVLPGSVCLQFSEKGLPTGEAMVAFESHDEAMSAVMDLNDRPIGARKVKISLG
ncbi:RNA-binding protein 12 [Osmerus mordax]|uniref:RNA-binding protein 12 n=1 Tax=Osmerus mordax TaxID=8014 RepID=UPI00350F7DC6